jgi:hypothetical protein
MAERTMNDADTPRFERAVGELNGFLNRGDGEQIVNSLCQGLDLLRDQLYIRVHDDVERVYGVDSMLMPVSETKTERVTKLEVEIYQVVSSCVTAGDFGYFPRDDQRLLPWLARLRLGDESRSPHVRERIDSYLAEKDHERRLAFLDVLARTAHEARHAPLVLFRLYPRAIQIVVATAFNNSQRAREVRDKQIEILPAIEGCDACCGRLLPNGTQCSHCGNPVWTYARMNLDE